MYYDIFIIVWNGIFFEKRISSRFDFQDQIEFLLTESTVRYFLSLLKFFSMDRFYQFSIGLITHVRLEVKLSFISF